MKPSILVFVPAFGKMVSLETFLSGCNLIAAMMKHGIGGGVAGTSYPDLPDIRNVALSIWYDTLPYSHLLFLDADMGFEAQCVVDMVLFNEPVVGALYRKKSMELQWAASGFGPDVPLEQREGFMKVPGLGMGLTLIRRDAVTKMLEKMPDLVDTRIEMQGYFDYMQQAGAKRIIRAFDKIDDPKDGPLSEDMSFCRRWTDCGGEVWASIAHKITHVGPHSFEGCYLTDAVGAKKPHTLEGSVFT